MERFSRRQFITGGAVAALGGTLALAGCAPSGSSNAKGSNGAGSGSSAGIGSGMGKHGQFDVEVMVTDGNLDRITVLNSRETPGMGDVAMEELTQLIVDNQTLNVDTVSGATLSSMAFIGAVSDALDQAGQKSSDWRKRDKVTPAQTELPASADVVVVGGGGAGFAAAITAANAGKSVVLLEKMGVFGGDTALSGGEMAAPGNWIQVTQGVKDSPEGLVTDMLVGGDNKGDPELVTIIANGALDSANWLTYEGGISWKHDLMQFGGHSIKRSIIPITHSGSEMTTKLTNRAREIETLTLIGDVKAEELIRDKGGAVTGVKVKDLLTDEEKTIECKAVVLTTGGFGRDLAFRQAQDPRLDDSVDCTNQEGATAESLRASVAAGAMAVHTDWIQLLPFMSPDEQGYGVAAFYTDGQASYAPTLDVATGKRIVNELTDRKRYADAILKTGQPCVQITCKKALYDGGSGLEGALKAGITTEFSSIEEAAEHYGMPVDAVKEEIARYNTFVANKLDEDFKKPIPDDAQTIDEPPFYGVRLWPKVHHCMGGVKTDLECRVVDMDLQVIPGLYAAGEAVGGIHGACRLGSCATADCLVNGRIAGQNAAKEQGA